MALSRTTGPRMGLCPSGAPRLGESRQVSAWLHASVASMASVDRNHMQGTEKETPNLH